MKNNKIKDKKSKIDIFDKLFMIFYFIDILYFLYSMMCIPIGRFNLTTIFIYLLVGGITYYLLKKHERKSTKEIKTESALYIIKILVVFFPVGVYLMWKNGKNKKLNAVFSVLLAIPIIFGLAADPLPDQSDEEEIPAIAYKKTIEPETTELHETSVTTTEKITTTSKTTQTTRKTTTTKTTDTTTTSTTSAESAELNFTQLYLDFFEPYEKSFNKLTLEEFQQLSSEKLADYDVQTTEGNENDLWSFTISDSNSDSVYIAFYADNSTYENPVEDWVWTLTTLSYNSNGKEISISDRFHINSKPTYTIYDKNAETPSKEVNSLDELKKFMFAVSKDVTTTETTTTTTTTTTAPPATEPPTEAPVTEAPPPPSEPVQPVIAESDYVLNTSTMKAHYPSCGDVDKIAPENRSDYYGTAEELQSMGYTSCGHCDAW